MPNDQQQAEIRALNSRLDAFEESWQKEQQVFEQLINTLTSQNFLPQSLTVTVVSKTVKG